MIVFYPDEMRKRVYSQESFRDTDKGQRSMIFVIIATFIAVSFIPFALFSEIGGMFVGQQFRWGAFSGLALFSLILLAVSIIRYVILRRGWRGSRRNERVVFDNGFLVYSWERSGVSVTGENIVGAGHGNRKAFGAYLPQCTLYMDYNRRCFVFTGSIRAAEYESDDAYISYDQMFSVAEGEVTIPDYFDAELNNLLAPYLEPRCC